LKKILGGRAKKKIVKKMFLLGTRAERAAAGRERMISFQITTRSARASDVSFSARG
jgi:hypothetical protein